MRIIVALVLIWFSVSSRAQNSEIKAVGKVQNVLTGTGILASIQYKSLPTGGITGRFNDSTFSFTIFGTAKYQITAVAPGYLPKTVIVDPKDIDATGRVVRNIPLTPEGQTVELHTLIFKIGDAVILPASYPELDEVAAMMKESESMVIQLEGHTDTKGDPKMNMKLSQKRVDAVQKYLITKGIEKNRIKTKAFGGTRPLSALRTPEAQDKNRRVEMRVLSH